MVIAAAPLVDPTVSRREIVSADGERFGIGDPCLALRHRGMGRRWVIACVRAILQGDEVDRVEVEFSDGDKGIVGPYGIRRPRRHDASRA